MLKETGQKVYMLTIEHRHGIDTYLCDLYETAVEACAKYVKSWWETELRDELTGEVPDMPADPEELIAQYFDEMGERNRGEWYAIEVLPVLTRSEEPES